MTAPSAMLKIRLARKMPIGLPGRSLRSTMPLVITPSTPRGEKLPAADPWMTISPISNGLIR